MTPLAMLACVRRSLRRPITQQVEQLLEAVMALEAALQENAPPHIIGELRFPGTGAAIPHIALLCARHMRLKSRGADTRVAEIVVVRVPKWSVCDHDVCHHSAESDYITMRLVLCESRRRLDSQRRQEALSLSRCRGARTGVRCSTAAGQRVRRRE